MDIEILGYLIFFKPYLDGIWVYDFEGLSCAQHFDTPIPCKWLHVDCFPHQRLYETDRTVVL